MKYCLKRNSYNNYFQVVVKSKQKKRIRAHVIYRGSGLKTLARSVGRKHRASIARQAMKDSQIKMKVLDILGRHVQKEMKLLCSKNTPSVLRDNSPDAVKKFSWNAVTSELETRAPTLFKVLMVLVVNRGFHQKSNVAPKKSRTSKPTHTAVVGMCAAILMKNRNVHLNLVQRVLSLALHSGHASKHVSLEG